MVPEIEVNVEFGAWSWGCFVWIANVGSMHRTRGGALICVDKPAHLKKATTEFYVK